MAGTASVLPPGAGARVLDFRRRGTPPRRRRRSLLVALLKPLATAFLVVALPAGLAAWVVTAPPFRLRAVQVGGASQRVGDDWVRQALTPLEGRNLVRLSLADTAERLHRNPWIESVEIAKELPDGLRVRVAERRPVALLLSGETLVYADREGRRIAPVAGAGELEEARRAGLLVVSFARGGHPEGIASALEVAAELGRVQPGWSAKLSRIEVLGDEDFRLHTEALPFPILVTRGQVGPKARRLLELLPELAQHYSRIAAVDLRFSRRIVVQPGPPLPPAGGTAGSRSTL
jgi:hypothetical protein